MESRNIRSTRSLMDLRTGTPIVDNIMSMFPSGHDKAFKYAFYNVIAVILAGVSILAFWAVCCILEPFLRPLLWALLCGSVLYPFKRSLVTSAQSWIISVRKSPVPFTVHVASTPLIIADSISDRIGNYVCNYWKAILSGLAVFFVTYFIYHNPPVTLGVVLKYAATTMITLITTLLGWVRGDVIITLGLVYVGIVVRIIFASKRRTEGASTPAKENTATSSHDEPDKPERTTTPIQSPETEGLILRIVSVSTWTLMFLYLCRSLPYPILVPFLICMVAGTVAYFRQRSRQSNYTIPRISMLATKLVLSIGQGNTSRIHQLRRSQSVDAGNLSFLRGLVQSPFQSPNTNNVKGSKSATANIIPRDEKGTPIASSSVEDMESGDSTSIDETDYGMVDSNKFLYAVFLACIIVQVWHHLWLVHLLPIPVIYYGVKKLCFRLGIVDFFKNSVVNPIMEFYEDNDSELSGNIFPIPVRALLRIMSIADHKLCEFCGDYLDPVASMVILVVVLLLTILIFLFAATQVYLEGDHLVRVSVDLVNTTVSQHPEINQLLPEGWESMMGSMVDNAYVYGKEYITNTIRDSIEGSDPQKAREIEKQVIEIWDKIYLSWNKTWDGAFNGSSKITNEETEGSGIEWNELLETGKSVPLLLEYSVLVNYIKANLGTLMSVVESVWNILVGNISVAFSAVMSVFSVLFGGGTAILNLIINLVVFITALFYLISSSTSVYKPVEVFRSSIPGNGRHSSRFLYAVEDSIHGVFTASFKMAAFYGMWTWLIHSLFQINIVFIPSFLAALFGAVPLLSHYWAALPAVLELVIIQGEWTLAILMMCAQMAPMSCVDTQIYSEIQGGGHPYLTGLSVAGGIFYFGMQGAIMGPLLLCCVFVAVKMASSFLLEEDENDSKNSGNLLKQLSNESVTTTPPIK